jgi:hypothetical protein
MGTNYASFAAVYATRAADYATRATSAVASAAASAAASADEYKWQADLLRTLISNPISPLNKSKGY